MKKISKLSLLLLVFFPFTNLIFSQDYYKFSEVFFNDTKSNHVEFLKKAITENNAEQLLIDFQNIEVENERDIQQVNEQIKSIEDNFKSNYTNPDYVYECKKTHEYGDEAKHLKTRLTYIETSLNIAKSSYNLCKNNVYRTGNCSQQQNNYNKQVNLYNSVLSELNSAIDNYEYYKDDCNDAINEYQNAYNYAKRRIDNLVANHEQRIELRNRKFNNYKDQINEVILNTPMFNIEYYDNGKKNKEGYLDLRTNQYVGNLKIYHLNGNLKLTCTIKDGEYDGTYTEYYETGIKKTEAEYKDGVVIGSWKKYNEEGVDEQDEMNKRIQDIWNEESAANKKYYETIDNSSVAQSIAENPIRTIKEDNKELVIDFSKASKETINFFLVRYDHNKSTELRKSYLKNFWDTQGEKVSCKFFNNEGKMILNVVYEGQIAKTESFSNDGSITKGKYNRSNRVGIWRTYDKNGKIIEEVDFDEQNKINAFEYFSKN